VIKRLLITIRSKPWLSLLVIVYIAGMIAYAIPKSRNLTETSDFYWVFWQSGKDFAEKHELYYREFTRPFNYMPFAAFVFQPLHLLPFRTSALIYFLINALLLPPLALYLIYKILRLMGVEKRKSETSLVLVTLFTLQHFWNNLTMFNINYILFVFILMGIYLLIQKKPHLAGIIFIFLTFIKIMPVLLAAYVFLFHFSRRVVVSMMLTAFICICIPAPFRGLKMWVTDHVEHYEKVITPYVLNGRVVTTKTNHNLKAGIVKTFHPESRDKSDVFSEYHPATFKYITILQLILLGVLVFNGIILKRRRVYFSLAYLASILLFMNLVSGLTWSAHMVTMMFCLLPLVLIDTRRLQLWGKTIYYLIFAMFLFLLIEGVDTTGVKINHLVLYYDIFTLQLLGFFLFCSWVIWSRHPYKIYQKDINI
jgi:hypothetical protein